MGGIAIVIAATTGWLFSDLFDGTLHPTRASS